MASDFQKKFQKQEDKLMKENYRRHVSSLSFSYLIIKDISRHVRSQNFTSFTTFVNKLLRDMLHQIKGESQGREKVCRK
jgi:hypothetical protein